MKATTEARGCLEDGGLWKTLRRLLFSQRLSVGTFRKDGSVHSMECQSDRRERKTTLGSTTAVANRWTGEACHQQPLSTVCLCSNAFVDRARRGLGSWRCCSAAAPIVVVAPQVVLRLKEDSEMSTGGLQARRWKAVVVMLWWLAFQLGLSVRLRRGSRGQLEGGLGQRIRRRRRSQRGSREPLQARRPHGCRWRGWRRGCGREDGAGRRGLGGWRRGVSRVSRVCERMSE